MAQRVPYSLFQNSQHQGSQWHSDYYTDFSWQSFLTIPLAQRLLHRLLLAISFDNPNGTATATQTSFGNFFWQSQWRSDCYTDFFWQFLLTIPMAQRLLHRLLLAISFDNPNGTATVTQTSFGNFFWQSQWHSDCYTDFFWQSAELRFSYHVCGKGRPSDQTWRPRLVSMKKTCAGNSHATLSPQFFYFHSRSKNPATANITPRKAAFQKLILQGCGTKQV